MCPPPRSKAATRPFAVSDRYFGAARLSPDNRRLYLARSDALNYRYSIQCIDLATGQELWQTELATGPRADHAGHLARRAGAGFGLGI